jgi:nitrogenase-associated protein
MATVIFYEKPGCKGNLRQKNMLLAAGHHIDARNLITETWTAEKLLAFLGKLEISEWFNRAAPAIKSGQIVPENLDFEEALHLLLDNPLLIRRPLMAVDEERRVGFDLDAVHAWIGLNDVEWPVGSIEACVHGPEGHGHCGSHAHEGRESADNVDAANATDAKEGSHECCGAHR